jgi:hypothetical protein
MSKYVFAAKSTAVEVQVGDSGLLVRSSSANLFWPSFQTAAWDSGGDLGSIVDASCNCTAATFGWFSSPAGARFSGFI